MWRGGSKVQPICCRPFRLAVPVHGELILKPLREADRSLGSEFANGSISTLFAVWECLQLLQPVYHRRVSYGCVG